MQQARTAPHPADKSGSPPVTVSPGGARDAGHSPGEAPPRAEGGAAAAAWPCRPRRGLAGWSRLGYARPRGWVLSERLGGLWWGGSFGWERREGGGGGRGGHGGAARRCGLSRAGSRCRSEGARRPVRSELKCRREAVILSVARYGSEGSFKKIPSSAGSACFERVGSGLGRFYLLGRNLSVMTGSW